MESDFLFLLAADALLFGHALFVAFVVFGLALIFIGKFSDWSWSAPAKSRTQAPSFHTGLKLLCIIKLLRGYSLSVIRYSLPLSLLSGSGFVHGDCTLVYNMPLASASIAPYDSFWLAS